MSNPKDTPPSNDEGSLPTTPNAQSRAAYFEDMLPGVIASDERDGRVVQASKRRRSGIPLTAEELHRDLKAVLTQLTVSFMQYENGFSTFLRTPTHALDYAERVAAYAMKDYPRDFEADPDIAGLWNALNNIHVIGYAWRKGPEKGDGKSLVSIVNKIAIDALNRVYPTLISEASQTNLEAAQPVSDDAKTAMQIAGMSDSDIEAKKRSTAETARISKADVEAAKAIAKAEAAEAVKPNTQPAQEDIKTNPESAGLPGVDIEAAKAAGAAAKAEAEAAARAKVEFETAETDVGAETTPESGMQDTKTETESRESSGEVVKMDAEAGEADKTDKVSTGDTETDAERAKSDTEAGKAEKTDKVSKVSTGDTETDAAKTDPETDNIDFSW